MLIYKGESPDLQNTWVADFKEGDEAYFATSPNGWSSNELGLQWLEKVFHQHTKDKAGNRRCVLLVDGHSSHVNMKFIDWADCHRIIIIVLPPHSTHCLQPLDVGLFSPLATAYSNQISRLMSDGFGLVSMTKRMFWPMFKVSWTTAFTEKNIKSAFTKTGIFPYHPPAVLDKIKCPEPPALPPTAECTPISCHAVRKAHRAFRESPSQKWLKFILHANICLAAQHSINRVTISGLILSLQHEKKKRSHGKKLNLMGESSVGAIVWSPTKVVVANKVQAEKEAQEQAEKDRIETNKVNAIEKRCKKEEEKAERAKKAALHREESVRQKTQKAAEVQA